MPVEQPEHGRDPTRSLANRAVSMIKVILYAIAVLCLLVAA
jgi:hypothetical protein